MPNHIKNKIELIGSIADIDSIIKAFGTNVPAAVNMTHDNEFVICKSKTEQHKYCWFDLKTGKVHDRGDLNQVGLPEGYEIELDDAYFHFPDFKKVIPQPDNIFNGDLGRKEEEMCKSEGRPTWYEWNRANWGTKWNSYSCIKEAINVYTFETAWSPVHKILEAMSLRFPSLVIRYTWADEDSGYNCGRAIYEGGFGYINTPEGGSIEAYDVYFELNPDMKKNFKLVGDKYEYIEEEIEG